MYISDYRKEGRPTRAVERTDTAQLRAAPPLTASSWRASAAGLSMTEPPIGLKTISDASASMITWALAIVGGSIATIVGTSYLRPSSECVRYIYLLFFPGWLMLGKSIWHGNEVSRRLIAAMLVPDEATKAKIGEAINKAFRLQLSSLGLGLACFGTWLALFLVWWIFGDWKP